MRVRGAAVTPSVVASLRRIGLFQDVKEQELEPLVRSVTIRSYARGQTVVAPGAAPGGIFGVLDGRARLYRVSPSGHEVTLLEFVPGEVFGLAFLSPSAGPRNILEAAGAGARVVHVEGRAFREFIAAHPCIGMAAFDLLGERVARICDRLEEVALHDARTRLAHCLVELAARDPEGWVFETHEDLAAAIASRQDEVSKMLRCFRETGLIQSEPRRRGLQVRDPKRLQSY